MANINDILAKMRKSSKLQDMKAKGDLGEESALQVVYARKQRAGCGLLYQSFEYPYQSSRNGKVYTGNICYKDGSFVEYTDESINDEIDILYITPYRVFVIEVKSYHARKLIAYDPWFDREGDPVYKSPIMQAEKHARHLYHAIHEYLPDGDPDYIIPMCCFVDKCELVDSRSSESRDYIPVSVLNSLMATISKYNTPLQYNIDLAALERRLMQIKTNIKRVL